MTSLLGMILLTAFMGGCAIKPTGEADNTYELTLYRITPRDNADSTQSLKTKLARGVVLESESVQVTLEPESIYFNLENPDSTKVDTSY